MVLAHGQVTVALWLRLHCLTPLRTAGQTVDAVGTLAFVQRVEH